MTASNETRPHPVPCACSLCCGFVERITEAANPGMVVNCSQEIPLTARYGKDEDDGSEF